ncbi:tetratricopeptide repeat protein [Deinococcus taeanensis]|uniref:tetratricopeptide repeat protein n=1 Tax=Deinococcus taeanensis TaxID=2737050 RepID=UPI001CDD0ADB|nr:tetratricopeptide repeat protein [Deinococcus taeanensis]UBV42570.1 tetratricopeptide repeat protein [Deinococcus taeanensis]
MRSPGSRAALLTLTLLTPALQPDARAATPHSADGWYALARSHMQARQLQAAEQAFTQAAALNPTAANWRALADTRAALRHYDAAVQAYEQAAARARARGDTATARATDLIAARYRQEGEAYLLTPGAAPPACTPRPAKLEPESGILLGRYADEQAVTASGTLSVDPRLGTPLAVSFRYFTLRAPGQGEAFPTRWVSAARRAGQAVHIALEPGMPLRQVTEQTLLPFARAARTSGVPIYLRFAGEFNDPSNEWSRDPALYRTRFRLVHDVMARTAPNVALVWMPMPSRLDIIDRYYPGPDAVDWVGLSLYATPYRNGNLRDSALTDSPLDALDPIYRRYACTHPIQISEFASSNRSGAQPGAGYASFAAQKLRELYWGAALRYPRVKNINWLDLNMLGNPYVQPRPMTRRNDYRLLDIPEKLAAFREVLTHPAFLTSPGGRAPLTPQPFPTRVRRGAPLQGHLWVRTAEPLARLTLTLDGRPVTVGAALPFAFTLPADLTSGPHTLTLTALNAAGEPLLTRARPFTVQ